MKQITVNINGQDYHFDFKVNVDVEILPVEAPYDMGAKIAIQGMNSILEQKAHEMAQEIKGYIEDQWDKSVDSKS